MSEPKLVLLKRVVLAFWWRLHGVSGILIELGVWSQSAETEIPVQLVFIAWYFHLGTPLIGSSIEAWE